MTGSSDGRTSIVPILSVNFVGTLGFSIVLPFLVFVVTDLGGNGLIYGVLGATYSFFQLIGAPILGRWSDRHGRRRILLLSQLGTLASWVIFLAALQLPVTPIASVDGGLVGAFTLTVPLVILFVARALDGLTGGNVSVANAYLADITSEEERSANFGKMAVSSNLGFILGPAIAGLLGATALGATLPVLAALAISVVASVIIAVMLPESRPCAMTDRPDATDVRRVMGQEQKDCFEMEHTGDASIGAVLRLPAMGNLLSQYFLVFLGFNFFYIAFPVHAATALEWTVREAGVFFSVLGAMMAFVQGPVLSRASKRWADRTLVIGGAALLAVSFLFFTQAGGPAVYTGAAMLALGNGVMWPSLLSIISRATTPSRQGAVQGVASSAGSVASIAGLLVGGLLYSAIGSAVFALSSVMTVAVLAMAAISPRPPTPTPAPSPAAT